MTLTIRTYVANKSVHNTATYILSNGVGIYHYKGKEYTESQFKSSFPIYGKIVSEKTFPKGLNPDKRKNYLNDDVCY